jgi:hypothetical protein
MTRFCSVAHDWTVYEETLMAVPDITGGMMEEPSKFEIR